MRVRFAFPFCLSAGLILAACGEHTPSAPSAADLSPELNSANTAVPIKGSFTGGVDLSIPPLACAAPATPSQPVVLTGTLSHLGRSTVVSRGCNTVTGFAFPTVFVSQTGSATITAANGDVLTTEYTGNVAVNLNCSALTVLDLVFPITGGTGRFAGGSGYLNVTGTQVPSACPAGSNPPPLFVEVGARGEISTVGSNKH